MAKCHAEIYTKDGRIVKCAYWNGGLETIKSQCMRQAQMEFDQQMRMSLDFAKPTHIQIVVDEY